MPKIVSLLASATEIVCALGLQDQLVGRAHECDYPAFVKKLPLCSNVDFPVNGSSSDIDNEVKKRAKQGHSLYKIDVPLIEKLRPEIILTQSHCKVCAVSKEDLIQTFGEIAKDKYKIVSLQPNCMDDIWNGIRDIAQVTGVPKRGQQLINRLQSGMGKIATTTKDMEEKPSVACIEWLDPLMTSGNWMPELIDMAGGTNLFGKAGVHSPSLKWEEVVKKDPDIILVMPCGFDLKRTREEIHILSSRKEWLKLNAVINNRVFLLDGNQFFNRPGPRLLESLEMLAEILHPGLFHFGHQHHGWEYCGVF